MNALDIASWRAAVIGRWPARIAGILMFLFFLAFFFGEGPPDLSRLTSVERIQALAIAALFLGLPVAWKWEAPGGLLTFAGFAFLAAVSPANLHNRILWLPALAAAIHLASWARLRMPPPPNLTTWRLPRAVPVSLFTLLFVFLLMCANEIFGQPPLMTPTLHPANGLAGDWRGSDVDFLIHPDGSVTGTIGETAIAAARITYGRSWFGRLLHINSSYRVTGTLADERFSAPFDYSGEALDGSLFLRNRPTHLTLTRRQP